MTGSEYIELLKKSPHTAHQSIFDEFIKYVYTIVHNSLIDCAAREDIEECVSDVFAAIYLDLDSKSDCGGDLKGYVRTIAKRKAVDKYRKLTVKSLKLVSIHNEDFNNMESDYHIEEETETAELQHILMTKIEELGEPDSSIIIQKYYYNRTSREIAENLSMKGSSVRMRCSRALKRLKKSLSEVGITL